MEIFYKLRKIVNKNTLIQVYYALVHSHLIYGILSWGRACKCAIRPLCVILNRIIKAICQSYGRYDAISPLYQELQILNIPQLYSMELLKFMLSYQYQHNLLPANFNSYFEKVKLCTLMVFEWHLNQNFLFLDVIQSPVKSI